jgi:apolipoprotein N-acyltransferase
LRLHPSRVPETLAARPRLADAVALLAGALTVLAFEPFALFPLAVLGPALLFIVWHGATARSAAWRGFLFGLGLFGAGVSWVFVSMHTFGNMSAPLAAIATMLFVAALALYPAALGAVQAWLARPGLVHTLLVVPALWALTEWWRGWFLTGFPWLNLGYSQSGSWLAGYAPVAGVYGVTLVCALLAGLLAAAVLRPDRWRRLLAAGAGLILSGILLFQIEWAVPSGQPLHVALVQGNVALRDKWKIDQRETNIRRYVDLSRPHLGADLIVWPEAAVPAALEHARPALAVLRGRAQLVLGAIEVDDRARAYYNAVANLATGAVYRKHHLVPFGEYLPLPWLFEGFIRQMHIPMSSFSRGAADQPPFTAAGRCSASVSVTRMPSARN